MKIWFKLFVAFFKTGLFTIGGGYAMLPILENELCTKTQIIEKDKIIEAYALGQTLPGVIAVNTSVFIGYQANKLKGVVAAVLGVTLPSILIIMVIATFITQIEENILIQKAFMGMRGGVLATLVVAVVGMVKKGIKKPVHWVLMLVTMIAFLLFSISPVYILLTGILLAIFYYRLKEVH